jgi:hypothetical protein
LWDGMPSVEFTFDGTQYSAVKETQTIQVDLKREFRYSLFGRLDKQFWYVQVWLWVSWPETNRDVVRSTHGQICEISGCKNLDFLRAYECKPSPSPSPRPTSSRSESPSRSRSPTATASRAFTPSQRLLVSRPLSSSNSFHATHFHSQTHPQFPSSSLSDSVRQMGTQCFTNRGPAFRRRGFLTRTGLFVWVLWLPPSN